MSQLLNWAHNHLDIDENRKNQPNQPQKSDKSYQNNKCQQQTSDESRLANQTV